MTDHEKAIRQVLEAERKSAIMKLADEYADAMVRGGTLGYVAARRLLEASITTLLTELDVARKVNEIVVLERNFARKTKDRFVDILVKIHQLLDPEPIEKGGKTFVYQNPDPQKVLRYLSDEIRRIPDAFDEAITQQEGAP